MNRSRLVPIVCGLPLSAALAQPCGTPWSQSPSAGPSARGNAAVAFDSDRARIVLFSGGFGLPDTWEWAAAGPGGGGSWTMRSNSGPSARVFAGLAYDSARQRTVLFGGQTSNQITNNQTWEWNGSSWTQVSPLVSPPAMNGYLMGFDASRQRTVLVSTLNQGAGGGVTWEFDGTTWIPFSGESTPVANNVNATSLCYDAARSRMVLVGGAVWSGSYISATWERTPTGWTLRSTDSLPQYLPAGPTTVFDPARQRVLFFDNNAYSGSTGVWAWDGVLASWSLVSTYGPPLTYYRRPCYDAAGGQVVLFGGTNVSTSTTLAQTWLFRSDSRDGPTITTNGPREVFHELGGPSFQLDVAAAEPVSYRWRLNGVELSDSGPFSGTATAHLTINPIDSVYSGNYDARVTDSCGTAIRPATYVGIVCYPNCDGSISNPRLNAEDFQCFLNAYAGGTAYANCDGSTVLPRLSANDFQCFLNKYAAGCP